MVYAKVAEVFLIILCGCILSRVKAPFWFYVGCSIFLFSAVFLYNLFIADCSVGDVLFFENMGCAPAIVMAGYALLIAGVISLVVSWMDL